MAVALAIIAASGSTAVGDSPGLPSEGSSDTTAPQPDAEKLAGGSTGKAGRVRIISAGRFRRGWTFMLGVGGGYQQRSMDRGDSVTGATLTGPDIGLGVFVEEWVAVMVRSVTTLAFPEDTEAGSVVPTGFGGAVAQLWPLDWLKVELGFGFGYHADAADLDEDVDFGFGFLTGLGVMLWHEHASSIQLGVVYTPLILDRSQLHPVCLELVWQGL